MSLIQNMPSRRNIIRLEPFGPTETRMQKMQLEPGDFQSEMPVQHFSIFTMRTNPLGLA